MAEREVGKKRYVFLRERTERWHFWLEVVACLIVAALVLAYAVHSQDGFWTGLWDALKKL
jgi:hypothetical protein